MRYPDRRPLPDSEGMLHRVLTPAPPIPAERTRPRTLVVAAAAGITGVLIGGSVMLGLTRTAVVGPGAMPPVVSATPTPVTSTAGRPSAPVTPWRQTGRLTAGQQVETPSFTARFIEQSTSTQAAALATVEVCGRLPEGMRVSRRMWVLHLSNGQHSIGGDFTGDESTFPRGRATDDDPAWDETRLSAGECARGTVAFSFDQRGTPRQISFGPGYERDVVWDVR